MSALKLVSTKIPDDWVDHLDKLAVTTGLSRSALAKAAIGQYLGLEEVDPAAITVDLRSELEDIKARLAKLEGSTLASTNRSTDRSTPMVSDRPEVIAMAKASTPNSIPSTPPIGLLRTGELLTALKARGYTRSMASLLRALNKAIEAQAVPDELASFGVQCDFEIKRSSNPLSGSVRWLSIG